MSVRLKVGVVVLLSVLITTVGIMASDIIQNVGGGLGGMVIESVGPCGEGSDLLLLGDRSICVDRYENSAGLGCSVTSPQNELDTASNMATPACSSVSRPKVLPWRFVSLNEAQQLCARSGKRLPTNYEWYKAASGLTNIEACAINLTGDSPGETSANVDCKTPLGTFDMVGNVWEWIDGSVSEGSYEGRELPPEGYVKVADENGVVVETSDTPEISYGSDYAWTRSDGVRGVIRGGFFGSGSDAGLYALNAAVPLDFRTVGIGFRCVMDVR